MFNYLRIFLFASLVFVVSSSIAGGLLMRSLAIEDLQNVVTANHASMAQGYINAVWRRYQPVIKPDMENPERLKTNPRVPYFAQETSRFFQKTTLVRVNVYTLDGQLLITSNISANQMAGDVTTPDKAFVLKNTRKSKATSQVVVGVPLLQNPHGKMVQTIIPFNVDNDMAQPAEAVLEIIYNITTTYNNIESFHVASICAVIFVFLSFLLILSISSRKAEAIISKQHEKNIELTRTASAAQAENAEKSLFLANISHELRTPLNAIIGFSDIIKTELLPTLPERKYDQYVNDINQSGVHLLSLINDILDYSKAEAGKLEIEISEVDVTKLAQNSLRLVMPRAEAGNVALVDDLPKEHIVMKVDSKKLKQVFLNLLSNAVKFTPAEGSVTISAWQTLGDDTVTFQVVDTGIGIAPKDISRAMSPFGQVDNGLKRKYEGTGLGLPLTKKFVEIMGGKFTIESEVDKGTKITFILPCDPEGIEGLNIKIDAS